MSSGKRAVDRSANRWTGLCLAILLIAGSLLTACGEQDIAPAQSSALPPLSPTNTPEPAPAVGLLGSDNLSRTTIKANLVGSGSTFAAPIYSQWLNANDPKSFVKSSPGVNITFQAIGSGSGRAALLGTPVAAVNDINPTVPTDFAGSDSPFNATGLLSASSKGQLVHLPVAVGAVVAIYNLKEVPQLKLSGPTLAAIFQGVITSWNDPAIVKENLDAKLPGKPITVVIRKKGTSSGTTDIFTRYLSVVSDKFREQFQPDGSFKWAIKSLSEGGTTLEGTTNEEVATNVRTGDGRIGYVDQGVADSDQLKTAYAAIRNKTGRFIYPNLDNVSAAASGSFIPDDFRTFIVDAEGSETYPIVGFTWLITWRDLKQMPAPSKDKAAALTSFLWWAIHQGQTDLPKGYAPLPASLVPRLERLFLTEKINNPVEKVFLYEGQPLLAQP